MSEPRKHHFLPVCYLKGFTLDNSPEGRLHCFDLQSGKQFAATPRTTAYERDLYKADVPEGEDAFFMEQAFSDAVEQDFSRVLNDIVSSQTLPTTEPDREVLLKFIAVQAARVPAALNDPEPACTKPKLGSTKRSTGNIGHPRDSEEKAMEQSGQRHASLKDTQKNTVGRGNANNRNTLASNPRITGILQTAKVLRDWIAERPCRLLVSDRDAPDLLCSDWPATMTFPQIPPRGDVSPESIRNGMLTFPLTRRMHISVYGGFETDGVLACPSSIIAAVNHCIALHASRFVYSPNEIFAYRANNNKLLDSRNLAPLMDYRKRRGAR